MKKTTLYRRQKAENLFEKELTIDALSAMGNPLEQLLSLVDFEMFRPVSGGGSCKDGLQVNGWSSVIRCRFRTYFYFFNLIQNSV